MEDVLFQGQEKTLKSLLLWQKEEISDRKPNRNGGSTSFSYTSPYSQDFPTCHLSPGRGNSLNCGKCFTASLEQDLGVSAAPAS
jgi:hypothetical protein